MAWLMRRRRTSAGRTAGRPPSGNGASSLHLRWAWRGAEPDLVEVTATLTVLERPAVPRLVFWALQAGFVGPGGRRHGAGHVGLQHHPHHPGSSAANWGGYGGDGRELAGSALTIPSATGNANTGDWIWEAGRPYVLGVRRGADGWIGSVDVMALRALHAGGDHLAGVSVWSEVFAHCEEPGGAVRWSDLGGHTADGTPVAPVAVVVNYQSHAAGGCSNTTAEIDDGGFVQRTATRRVVPQGARLALSAPRPGGSPRPG